MGVLIQPQTDQQALEEGWSPHKQFCWWLTHKQDLNTENDLA